MLLANWLDVPDAMVFLDAFAEAAEKTCGWKLDSIKTDYGHQFVYVRYTGRKFAGSGLMASAFAPLEPRTGRKFVAGWRKPPAYSPSQSKPRRGERTSGLSDIPLQRVNITLRADQWPTHVCFDQSAERLFTPLINAANKATRPLAKSLRIG